MKIRCIDALGKKTMYISDIHNFFSISNEAYERYEERDEIDEEDLIELIETQHPEMLDKYRDILKSTKSISVPVENEAKHREYSICFHPSRRCNLKCKYCFGEDEHLPDSEITFETAKDCIDFMVFNYAKKCNKLTVDLSGSGEPLLRFDFIKALHDYCYKLRAETQINIIIGFATNATLINDEIAHFLRYENKCLLYGVSIDGNEHQDSNRVFKNGKPTYPIVVENIKKINNGLLGLAVTITPQNTDVDVIYDNLKKLNTDAISMHFVRRYDDSQTSLYNIDLKELFAHYEKLMHILLNHVKIGDLDYIMPLLRGDDVFGGYIKRAFQKGSLLLYRCDAGRNRLAVDAKGNIYNCSVLNGCKDFCLGNIYNGGIDEERQKELTQPSLLVSKTCSKCWCRNICAGECLAGSYYAGVELYEPIDSFCTIRKQLAAFAVAFVQMLADEYPDAYRRIYGFLVGTIRFTLKDSAAWSIHRIVQRKQDKVTFTQILDQIEALKRDSNFDASKGTHPRITELVLKQYNDCYCAVGIQDKDTLLSVHELPCVAYLNNPKLPFHTYIVIEDIKDGKVQFITAESEKVYSVDAEIFLSELSNIFIGVFTE